MSEQSNEWFMYVIRCKDYSLYCGIAKNVAKRFSEHRSMGKKTAKYLRGKGPLELVFVMSVGDYSEALKAEREFKSLSKKQKEILMLFN